METRFVHALLALGLMLSTGCQRKAHSIKSKTTTLSSAVVGSKAESKAANTGAATARRPTGFEVAHVSAELRSAKSTGKNRLYVLFDATPSEEPARDSEIVVEASCLVGGQLFIDHVPAQSTGDWEKGAAASVQAALWSRQEIQGAPTECTLSVGSHVAGAAERAIGTYCFTPPWDVRAGDCGGAGPGTLSASR